MRLTPGQMTTPPPCLLQVRAGPAGLCPLHQSSPRTRPTQTKKMPCAPSMRVRGSNAILMAHSVKILSHGTSGARWLGQQKLWFFRQWHHTSNLPPNLLDRHPDTGPDSAADRPDRSYWPRKYKVWTTHGWQLVLTATATEHMGDLCEHHHQLHEQAAFLSYSESRGTKRTSDISVDVDSYQNVVTTVLQQLLTQQPDGTIQLQNLPPSDQAQLLRTTIHQVTALPRRPEGSYSPAHIPPKPHLPPTLTNPCWCHPLLTFDYIYASRTDSQCVCHDFD